MARETSVVTAERFAQGFSYPDYLAQIKVNKEWFQRLYDNFRLDEEDADFFRMASQHQSGPAKMMVIGEEWCPDVYRGMPVMARIAEAGGMETRVFPRDSHMDIMNEFLKEGKWASIPTVVFYTRDLRYICHWIERPAPGPTGRWRRSQPRSGARCPTPRTPRYAPQPAPATRSGIPSGSKSRYGRSGRCWLNKWACDQQGQDRNGDGACVLTPGGRGRLTRYGGLSGYMDEISTRRARYG